MLRDKILSVVRNKPGISFDELCSKLCKSGNASRDDISSELRLLVRESKLHEVVFKGEKLYYITGSSSSKNTKSSVGSSGSSGSSTSLGIGTLFLTAIAIVAVIYFFCFTDLGFSILYGFVLLMIIIGFLVVIFK